METNQPRSRSWGWLLILFTIATLIEAIFWGQIGAFTPLYLPQLGVARSQVPMWTGAIVTISSAAGLPFLPFWGALADRYARQPIIARSFVAYLLSCALILLAPNLLVFVLARSMMSLSMGNTGLMMTTLSERAPSGRTGLAFSILNSASPLGAVLGPLIGGPVVDAYGFRWLIAADTGVMLLVILALTYGYRDRFQGTEGSILRMAFGSVESIWQSRRLRTLFPALFLLFAGWMLVYTYVPVAVGQLYHGADRATAVGRVLGAGGVATLILSPLLGLLADKLGHWKVLVVGAGVQALLWPIPALTSTLVAFAVSWAVINGLASGIFAISFSVLAAAASSSVRGRVMSFAFLPAIIGSMIGPAIGTVVTSRSVFAVFPAAAIFTALGVGATVLAQRQPTQGEQAELTASQGFVRN